MPAEKSKDNKQTRIEAHLIEAIRDNLSPHAVALIIAKCQPHYGTGEIGQQAEREVAWFTEQLIGAIGADQFNQLCGELGV